ncbi:eighth largest subunit of RSC [Scheffersomyces xylosifermentans]|uniref:eighth largest subunit of RSC n=1 Tax=Scheffersomyces xylosifermentans TaxID=1304137 RepID=UPI00315D3919
MSSIEPETPAVETPTPLAEETPAAQSESVKNELSEADDNDDHIPKVDVEQLKAELQEKAKIYLAEQTAHVVIPSFSKWFDLDNVHSIEKKSFPDFFNESAPKSVYKSEEIYKDIRDFIVNTYRLSPREYLTVTAVRKNLAGDVTTIIRVHQFLERWGIINYQIDPRTKSSIVGPQYTGHFQITLDSPTGLVPFVPENAKVTRSNSKNNSLPYPAPSSPESEVSKKSTNTLPLNLEVRRNVYTAGSKKASYRPNNAVQYSCSICGKDSTEVRYHNLKIKSYAHNPSSTINNASILCTICYDQGLFPSNFVSSDFVKLSKNNDLEEWTEQEVLLLLEGIEMFATYDAPSINGSINANSNSQWEKISEHVGTKAKEQCLIKFIQLPIEDKYLNRLINGTENSEKAGDVSSETLIQDVVKKLISDEAGRAVLKQNAQENLKETVLEETNLVNQIIELTLEKFNHKLSKIDALQDSLLRVENQLNLERKQVLIERWVQFEKIQKLKSEKPELAGLLDDLIKPVRVNEINKSLNPVKSTDNEEMVEVDQQETSQIENDKLPVSVSKPKSYQYWSG